MCPATARRRKVDRPFGVEQLEVQDSVAAADRHQFRYEVEMR
jgi:hypothetical protein